MTIATTQDAKIAANPIPAGIDSLTPGGADPRDVIDFGKPGAGSGAFTDDQVRNYLPLVRQVAHGD